MEESEARAGPVLQDVVQLHRSLVGEGCGVEGDLEYVSQELGLQVLVWAGAGSPHHFPITKDGQVIFRAQCYIRVWVCGG